MVADTILVDRDENDEIIIKGCNIAYHNQHY